MRPDSLLYISPSCADTHTPCSL